MAPIRVKPYGSRGKKNDAADAAAIAEAGSRESVPRVGIKSICQQDLASMQRLRSLQVGQRTALGNQVRGLLLEYGITIVKGHRALREMLREILSTGEQKEYGELSACLRDELGHVERQLLILDNDIDRLEKKIIALLGEHEVAGRMQAISGVGPMTVAALLSTVACPSDFSSGRGFSAYLGLVPRQHSTGGKPRLVGISKHGPKQLRVLLIHGARSSLNTVSRRAEQGEPIARWALRLRETKGYNKAAVALANKMARILWAIWVKQEKYDPAKGCRASAPNNAGARTEVTALHDEKPAKRKGVQWLQQ